MPDTDTRTLSQQMESARWDYRDKLLMYGGDLEHPAIKNHPYLQALRILSGDSELSWPKRIPTAAGVGMM